VRRAASVRGQADKRTLNEYEAGLRRQAATDVLAGVWLSTIVRQWNDAGVARLDRVWK
jgi:hypothetical protein